MSRFARIVMAVGWFLVTGVAEGATEFRLSVAGLASNMPAEGYDFGMDDYFPWYGSGAGGAGKAKTTDVKVTRVIDAFSPSVVNAVISGTPYSSATIDVCKPNCSSSTAYLSLLLEDVLLNRYKLGSGGSLPEESIGINYSKMTVSYRPTPTPPQTGWGAFLPRMLPVGSQAPYSFDFFIDAAAAEDMLGRPLSPLGDFMPDTLFNVSAVPEPSTLMLILAGMFALSARRRL